MGGNRERNGYSIKEGHFKLRIIIDWFKTNCKWRITTILCEILVFVCFWCYNKCAIFAEDILITGK